MMKLNSISEWIAYSDRHYGPTSDPSNWLRERPGDWKLPDEDRMVWILWAINAGVVPRGQITMTTLKRELLERLH